MRFALLVPALYALATAAAPVSTDAQSSVASPKTQAGAITALLPSLRKFLTAHPNIEADIAQHNSLFAAASNPNTLDYTKIQAAVNQLNVNQEPAPAADLAGSTLSGVLNLLGYIPGAIVGGVSGILSSEYTLISTIFSTLWKLVPSFGPGGATL